MGELIHRLQNGWHGQHVVFPVRRADLPQARELRSQAAAEGLGEWDRSGRVELSWVPPAAATDPQCVAGGATTWFHAALLLSPG